jgi:hypothetical protein
MPIGQAPPGIAKKMGVNTSTDFVVYCENNLGWVAPTSDKVPLWKARANEAGKLNRQMKLKPGLVTLDNLMLAVEYCRVAKEQPASPTALCWRIEKALKAAVPAGPSVTAMSIDDAIKWERDFPDAESDRWITLLTRAVGPARDDLLTEWRSARHVH